MQIQKPEDAKTFWVSEFLGLLLETRSFVSLAFIEPKMPRNRFPGADPETRRRKDLAIPCLGL